MYRRKIAGMGSVAAMALVLIALIVTAGTGEIEVDGDRVALGRVDLDSGGTFREGICRIFES